MRVEEPVLEIESKHKFSRKSADVKILAKFLGFSNWRVYEFCSVVNGNKYVSTREVSWNHINSPCSEGKEIRGNVNELNRLWIDLQIDEGYKSYGKFERDICGAYRRA